MHYYSRAFTLPKNYFKKNFTNINNKSDNETLFSIFDNNRYAQRQRIKLVPLKDISLKLFDIDTIVSIKAVVHNSDNVAIFLSINPSKHLDDEQIDRLNKNWIPTENIISYKNHELHIRNILNYGFALFLSTISNKELELEKFLSLKAKTTYKYSDIDIQEIERVYEYNHIDTEELFIIPTMYGNTSVLKKTNSNLITEDIKDNNIHINNNTTIYTGRNHAYIVSSCEDTEKYIYTFTFFNILKHLKNKTGTQISFMLDKLNDEQNVDYSDFLEESLNLKTEFTINYDEYNNINIWHDGEILKLSNHIRAQEGWNISHEIEENKNKLLEFIELTSEMSKGKLQSFMDSVSMLIGILGVFAIFDLVQTLTGEPYTGLPWYISFVLIVILLPLLLMFLGKKSKVIVKLFNKILD